MSNDKTPQQLKLPIQGGGRKYTLEEIPALKLGLARSVIPQIDTLSRVIAPHSQIDALSRAFASHSQIDALSRAFASHSQIDALSRALASHSRIDALSRALAPHSRIDALLRAMRSDFGLTLSPSVRPMVGVRAEEYPWRQQQSPNNPLSVARTFLWFISYAKKDEGSEALAESIAKELQQLGDEAVVATRFIAGSRWREKINEGIRDCDGFVALQSPSYGKTEWTIRELQSAEIMRVRVFPIYLFGDCDEFLNEFHRIDGLKGPAQIAIELHEAIKQEMI